MTRHPWLAIVAYRAVLGGGLGTLVRREGLGEHAVLGETMGPRYCNQEVIIRGIDWRKQVCDATVTGEGHIPGYLPSRENRT
jgi:hypothetical protein